MVAIILTAHDLARVAPEGSRDAEFAAQPDRGGRTPPRTDPRSRSWEGCRISVPRFCPVSLHGTSLMAARIGYVPGKTR
jgi:hypothetical protein